MTKDAKKTYDKTRSAYFAEYRLKNREALNLDSRKRAGTPARKASSKKYRENNKEKFISCNRRSYLKREYGVTPEKYDEMQDCQSNSCAICHRHQSKLNVKLAIDHCHKTGKVRGLLCQACNRSLGGFNDNIILLTNAILYLQTKNAPLEINPMEHQPQLTG